MKGRVSGCCPNKGYSEQLAILPRVTTETGTTIERTDHGRNTRLESDELVPRIV
jgi:hypothetical protein